VAGDKINAIERGLPAQEDSPEELRLAVFSTAEQAGLETNPPQVQAVHNHPTLSLLFGCIEYPSSQLGTKLIN
jgi:hypothetical protein